MFAVVIDLTISRLHRQSSPKKDVLM